MNRITMIASAHLGSGESERSHMISLSVSLSYRPENSGYARQRAELYSLRRALVLELGKKNWHASNLAIKVYALMEESGREMSMG